MNGATQALLLHGNAGSGAVWHRVVAALADDVPASAIDFPGFGATGGPPLDADTGSCIDATVRILRAPVVLCGNGIGSVLCGHAAARLGDVVRGVVMTGPVGLDAGHAKLGWLSRTTVGASLLRAAGRTVGRRRFLGDQLASPEADPEAAAILLRALREARGFHHLARLNRPESLAGLREIRCPVTVLWGERDGVLPVTHAEEFMSHLPPHARLEVVPGASHALPLERPDLVAGRVRELA